MAGKKNYVWEVGTDDAIDFIFKKGPTPETVEPVNLTGYSLRMDLSLPGDPFNPERVATLNSDDNVGGLPADAVGPADNEATLDADGRIFIKIPRSLTLPGGVLYTHIQEGITVFNYDLLIRDNAGKQDKILGGTVTIKPTVTIWV